MIVNFLMTLPVTEVSQERFILVKIAIICSACIDHNKTKNPGTIFNSNNNNKHKPL